MPTVPLSELSRPLSAAPKSLRAAVNSGLLRVCGKDANGRELFDLEESIRRWRASEAQRMEQARHDSTPSEMRGGRPRKDGTHGESLGITESGEENFHQALVKLKAHSMAIRVQRERLEFEAEQKKYVLREDERKAGAALASIIEDELDKRPARLSSVLATMDDELEIFKMLTEENNLLKEKVREVCGAV